MSIADWPADERPREKLQRRGAPSLSDAELLAIFLRVGHRGRSAVDIARELLARFGGLQPLFSASADVMCNVKGVGAAKAAQLQAVLELARRVLEEELPRRDVLSSPATVRGYLQAWLRTRACEVFVGIFLDARNQVLAAEELFHGTVNQTAVYPREVVKRALQLNATSVIVAHNHPSGSEQPSVADELLTRQLKAALALVDIRLLDHMIVAGTRVVSLVEEGLFQ